MNRTLFTAAAAALLAGSANAIPVFLTSDGNTVFRGDTNGVLETYSTTELLGQDLNIISYTFSPDEQSVYAITQQVNGVQNVYRIDNAFVPSNTLDASDVTFLGTSNARVASIDFDENGQLYGTRSDRVLTMNSGANFNSTGTATTFNVGGQVGGLQVNADGTVFYVHSGGNDALYEIDTVAGTTTKIADAGFDFVNSGLEAFGGGFLAALANEDTDELVIGTWNTVSGDFNVFPLVDLGTAGNGSVGFLAQDVRGGLPTPGAVALVGLAGLTAARRRRD